MSKKIIAIGNRHMQDDGVALVVGERIRELLHGREVEVIISEDDLDYCLRQVDAADDVYIMDSTYYGIVPGSITYSKFNYKKEREYISSSMYGLSLVDMLYLNRKKANIFFIGIEIGSAEIGIGLSDILGRKIDDICNHIIKIIL